MRFTSKIALGVALALGSTAVVTTAPALAQKEKKAKAGNFKLSEPVRNAVSAAQKALAANDTATAGAQLAAAKAAATTEDEKYVTASVGYDLGRQTNNATLQLEGIETMLASGRVPAEQQPNFYLAMGQLAYQAKQYAKAEQALDQAQKLGATDPNLAPLLIETKAQTGKPVEAVETLEAAVARNTAAGQPVPSEWYGRGLSIALGAKPTNPADKAKLAAATGRLTQSWISAYPTKSNWRDALIIYRDTSGIDAEQELDLFRLMRTAAAMKGERDYMDYVQATYLKFPGEAKAVLEEGQAAGFVNLTAPGNAKEIYAIVKGKIAADKASLSKSGGTGKAALANGDAYMGYGDYTTAADLYRAALTKGGVDANVVNTRLGMALVRAGQKDAARQAFAAVTGSRAPLAKFWTIYIDKSST